VTAFLRRPGEVKEIACPRRGPNKIYALDGIYYITRSNGQMWFSTPRTDFPAGEADDQPHSLGIKSGGMKRCIRCGLFPRRARGLNAIRCPERAIPGPPPEVTPCQPRPFGPKSGGMGSQSRTRTTCKRGVEPRGEAGPLFPIFRASTRRVLAVPKRKNSAQLPAVFYLKKHLRRYTTKYLNVRYLGAPRERASEPGSGWAGMREREEAGD